MEWPHGNSQMRYFCPFLLLLRLQNSRFFFLSKSVKKSVKRLSPVSLSVFSLVRDLLFDCSRVLEYAKVQTVLQSTYCWPITASRGFCDKRISSKNVLLLVFSVTPFKIDQNKNQNRSIDKVQNLGNERRDICKDPRQDSGQRNISHTRYPKKCFTQTYRDL